MTPTPKVKETSNQVSVCDNQIEYIYWRHQLSKKKNSKNDAQMLHKCICKSHTTKAIGYETLNRS